jgi:hypothetical protein
VNVAKSLWAAIQGDPVFMRRVNGWLALFWVAMIPVSYELGWLKSVVYVSALSLWALVSGHWSAWQAARVEVSQQEQVEAEAEHPVEQRVVEKTVDRTELEPSSDEDGGEQGSPPSNQAPLGSSREIDDQHDDQDDDQKADQSVTRSSDSKQGSPFVVGAERLPLSHFRKRQGARKR